MTSYAETMLWIGQHELITKINDFLATRSVKTTERQRAMLIFSCKANGANQLGYGISTALRHALCSWPRDIEWRCLGRRAAMSVLDKLPPLHAAKTDWILVRHNHEQLWYRPPNQPTVLYKRQSKPIYQGFVSHGCTELTVYDDVRLCTLNEVLADIMTLIQSSNEQCIVALTVQMSQLDQAREVIQKLQISCHLFDTICDVTDWYTDRANEDESLPSWKHSPCFKEKIELLMKNQTELLRRESRGYMTEVNVTSLK